MKYFKKLVGERIYLSPVCIEDAEQYTEWLNDFAVSGFLGTFSQSIGLTAEKKILEKMAAGGQDFAIVNLETDRLMGNISLMNIDHISRKATVGLFIGEAENRGMGYGTEALRLILDYGFHTLNLHNVMLQVYADNEAGLACYQKVGFREFGRRRDAKFKDGKYVDEVHMDILETDFYS